MYLARIMQSRTVSQSTERLKTFVQSTTLLLSLKGSRSTRCRWTRTAGEGRLASPVDRRHPTRSEFNRDGYTLNLGSAGPAEGVGRLRPGYRNAVICRLVYLLENRC